MKNFIQTIKKQFNYKNYDFNYEKIYKDYLDESKLYNEPRKIDGILWNKLN
jgi:hypothetical protein